MLLSLFTPTNNPAYLHETYDSLLRQGHKDFEWVLVPNGGCKPYDIPQRIRNDPRTVIHPYEHKNVGALKRYACDRSTGGAFIEMDHDDLLVPGALARINKCYEEGAGFVYSDVAGFDDGKLTPQRYSGEYGWSNYGLRVYNRVFYATRTFPITARSLCSVHYAPDHVRSWSKEAYYRAGGHNQDMLVADDHDLICRTYLAGVTFKHTGACDYLYRFHGGNTVKRYNDEIQKLQKENQDRYMWRLIDEWLRREALKFEQLKPGYPAHKRLPFGDNSIGCLKAWNVLQFIPQKHVEFALTEMYRVLVPGGWLCLRVPSTDGRGAWLPAHKSWWNEETIRAMTHKDDAKAQLPSYRGRFQQVRCWTKYDNTEAEKRVLTTLYADLMALKNAPVPGRQHI